MLEASGLNCPGQDAAQANDSDNQWFRGLQSEISC